MSSALSEILETLPNKMTWRGCGEASSKPHLTAVEAGANILFDRSLDARIAKKRLAVIP